MDPLVSRDVLAARLGAPDLVVCDVRWYLTEPERGHRDYQQGHVPGAQFVDLHHDLAGGPGGGRHPLPDVEAFTARLCRWGIAPDDTVIAYDDSGGAIAARLWWMLRAIGHEHVAVLDGGWFGWRAASLPVTAAVETRPATGYPAPEGWRGVVGADDVAAAPTTGTTVIDARSPTRYRGDDEPIDPRAGHIPGAINLFHGDNLDDHGRHRSPAELSRRFDTVGDAPIVYCGSGVTACHDILALAVAGRTDARLFPGSWSEWSSDPARPVATGDEPGGPAARSAP